MWTARGRIRTTPCWPPESSQYPRTVLADWDGLVSQNPGWLYSDSTHLPIDGPGAQALANLVASKA